MRLALTLWRFTPLLLLAAFWEAISQFGLVSEFALPPFSDVVVSFTRLTEEGLWAHPMPKSALIPLTIMWIGLGDQSKITLIFIGCLLPVVLSAFNAARGVDQVLIWSARSMGAREREVLWQVVVPAAMPEILSGIRIALALAFILLVSGELIIANNGIGYLIDLLGEGGDYAGMFAGVATISAIGFFADRAYVALTRRLLVWRD